MIKALGQQSGPDQEGEQAQVPPAHDALESGIVVERPETPAFVQQAAAELGIEPTDPRLQQGFRHEQSRVDRLPPGVERPTIGQRAQAFVAKMARVLGVGMY